MGIKYTTLNKKPKAKKENRSPKKQIQTKKMESFLILACVVYLLYFFLKEIKAY